jgi:hypothetical protein
MEHGMVIRTQDPDMMGLRISGAHRDTIPPFLMVDVYNPVLSADHALTRNIRAAPKESRNAARPPAVVNEFGSLPIIRIAVVESMSASSPCFFRAGIRTVSPSPIVSVNSWKKSPAYSAKTFLVWMLPVFSQVVFFAVLPLLAFLPTESLIDLVRAIALAAKVAFSFWIGRQNGVSLSSASTHG